MINKDKWISSLPKTNSKFIENVNQLDHEKWTDTIAKKNSYYPTTKKYSLLTILFVCGLLFVSVVKNETRNLQKDINDIQTSIKKIKFNLDQAILDNEVITSPENITKLAKEYLNSEFIFYKKSQIKNLNNNKENLVNLNKTNEEKINKTNEKKLQKKIKIEVAKKIEKKKMEIKKLQELYKEPEAIPEEIKIQVAKQIKQKKIELKDIYNSPKDVFTSDRLGRWAAVQVVKVFLGIPVVPGR